jgi:zinc transport system substrate-binding protein
MDGVGQPHLLFRAGASPHVTSLKPSQMRRLANADLVVWVGEDLEVALVRPLRSVGGKVLTLAEAAGLTLLTTRSGGEWEHDEHEHEHEDGHPDMHLWLDPANGVAIVKSVGAALAGLDSENAQRYRQNVASMVARLEALDRDLRQALLPVKSKPYVVFHDAYQYLEKRYGLSAVGSVTVSPDRPAGAKRIRELRARLRTLEAHCVFSEPQFPPNLVSVLIEDTEARTGVLDPLGASLEPGPESYFQLMKNLAAGLKDCLAP